MRLTRLIEREKIKIEKLLIPSNSGLQDTSPNPFNALGIKQRNLEVYRDENLGIEVLLKRGEDIPELCDYFTDAGIPVFGMTGDDLVDEYKLRVPASRLRLIDTEDWIISPEKRQMYSRPTLAFIGPEGAIMGEFPEKSRVVVNAKYGYTAREWLADVTEDYGVEFVVRELNGKTETEIPDRADFVIDIVVSGSTLKYVDSGRTVERNPSLTVLQPIRQSDMSIVTSWQNPRDMYITCLEGQYRKIEERNRNPADSLTSSLFQDSNRLIKKLGEENAELVAAVIMRDKANFLEELQQSAGGLPMVAAVSLGITFDEYLGGLTGYGK